MDTFGPAQPRGVTWNGAGAWLMRSQPPAGELLAHVLEDLPGAGGGFEILDGVLSERGHPPRDWPLPLRYAALGRAFCPFGPLAARDYWNPVATAAPVDRHPTVLCPGDKPRI